ncbi:putative membrane protein [Acorus calamus]|uniref:Membrane protein n=1 Tax=Acorus calamus TaxID=4465 RepID=A0AAV9DL02_ACOCL|nr:putative membrane protein [Acorus calamus]
MLGIMIDVPAITFLVAYKAPIMLFKGWHRLVQDLIGRRGPFLETVCVPFAGLSILLWPLVVALASFVGILSSVFLGLYAAVVAYQEHSTKYGLAYIISVISMFDEYTNDLLYLREGSCFPRLRHLKADRSTTGSLPVKLLPDQSVTGHAKRQPTKTPSMKMQELKAVMIWQNFFKACETIGKTLVQVGAIQASDLQEWQYSKNKIVNVGLPAYAFLMCFLRSIEKGSTGFVMRDNVELTRINRPEGRAFDWFFEPMTIMKEQLKTANLNETEVAGLLSVSFEATDIQALLS